MNFFFLFFFFLDLLSKSSQGGRDAGKSCLIIVLGDVIGEHFVAIVGHIDVLGDVIVVSSTVLHALELE